MKVKDRLKQSVAGYLDSTTIHGLGYLKAGRNICERFVWFVIIVISFTLAATLIYESIDEANRNPILTNIETLSLKDVPFPAVTIDSGQMDPWGHVRKVLNGLAFDNNQAEVLAESLELNKEVDLLLSNV